ncbi:spike base protein, RCAP_Rcc01079 family [Segnochrobactrum spirostomi]|uniref:Uncharacterized protein n=1 Tax=Segnochrobactrum spirostomi TaxID=2608987 RepID=A0A6A7Y0C5_9HYPH|nr:hypothetical protein [Segnochrobactrum spirostomi]MQT12313.1 hypothetical protein [Segnochrobactrum spirostomi]
MSASDRFATHAPSAHGPATRFFAIAPSDGADLPELVRGLYVGGGGDVVAVDATGAVTTFRAVPAGTVLPIRAAAVRTASTASDLVGLV